jgi:SSS family solute:Na+ symporter
LGAWLVAMLKVIMPFIFILPGIICLVLVNKGMLEPLESPDHAYLSMVMGLLPTGLIGLALATLIVSIINDVATGISAFSTVFAMDFYGKKINPDASAEKMSQIGKKASWIAGIIAVLIAIFFSSSDKGLFELGQSLCTYLAPPVSTVFILGLVWKRATPLAAELTLYLGTAICLTIGFCQLINFPSKDAWPHFMLLCFYMMVGLVAFMFIVSLFTRNRPAFKTEIFNVEKSSSYESDPMHYKLIRVLWIILAVIMFTLYYIFN